MSLSVWACYYFCPFSSPEWWASNTFLEKHFYTYDTVSLETLNCSVLFSFFLLNLGRAVGIFFLVSREGSCMSWKKNFAFDWSHWFLLHNTIYNFEKIIFFCFGVWGHTQLKLSNNSGVIPDSGLSNHSWQGRGIIWNVGFWTWVCYMQEKCCTCAVTLASWKKCFGNCNFILYLKEIYSHIFICGIFILWN